jgi:hypothetical protein
MHAVLGYLSTLLTTGNDPFQGDHERWNQWWKAFIEEWIRRAVGDLFREGKQITL